MVNEKGASFIKSALGEILSRYWKARSTETISNAHPVCALLAKTSRHLADSAQAQRFANVVFKWSAGQGNWATIPWIAALDTRETARTSSGVYVVYLFRADMSGLYLTLNQGTSRVVVDFGRDAHNVLRKRAAQLRRRAQDLPRRGFVVGQGIDLRHDAVIVRGYEAGAVAHKLYERDRVPRDGELLDDLDAVLEAYSQIVPSRRLIEDEAD